MADKSNTLSTLSSTIRHGVENRLKDLHTAMPGIIKAFDPEKQTASVQPAIKRVFKTTESESEILVPTDLPLLINVPVVQPRGGGFSITFPIKPGDECLLVFCERSIDIWQKFGDVQKPGARRFHNLSDATAFVGLSSQPNVIPNYDPNNVQIKKDDGSVIITLKDNGDLDLHANTNITADCVDAILICSGSADVQAANSVDITAPTINLNGDVNVSGLLSANGGIAASPKSGGGSSTFIGGLDITGSLVNNTINVGSTHVHPQGVDSNGDSQQNTGVPQ